MLFYMITIPILEIIKDQLKYYLRSHEIEFESKPMDSLGGIEGYVFISIGIIIVSFFLYKLVHDYMITKKVVTLNFVIKYSILVIFPCSIFILGYIHEIKKLILIIMNN